MRVGTLASFVAVAAIATAREERKASRLERASSFASLRLRRVDVATGVVEGRRRWNKDYGSTDGCKVTLYKHCFDWHSGTTYTEGSYDLHDTSYGKQNIEHNQTHMGNRVSSITVEGIGCRATLWENKENVGQSWTFKEGEYNCNAFSDAAEHDSASWLVVTDTTKQVATAKNVEEASSPAKNAEERYGEAAKEMGGRLVTLARLYTQNGSFVSAVGACYCSCCAATAGQSRCNAHADVNKSLASGSCRSSFCTSDASQVSHWTREQWTGFCAKACAPTESRQSLLLSCRPQVCDDAGNKMHCS